MGLLYLAASVGCAAETPRNQLDKLTTRLRVPESVSTLPDTVHAVNGQLTLFADFSDIRGDYVVLYLVNRTDRRIAFSAQDGDPYLKLEAWDESGYWKRAQKHYASFCGNSYFRTPALKPEQFFRFLGYYPATGEPATVRYRIYHDTAYVLKDDASEDLNSRSGEDNRLPLNLVSNTGQGLVKTSDLAEARYDSMAIRYGTFETIREMAMGRAKPSGYARWSQLQAVKALQRFPNDEAAVALENLLDNENQHIRREAIQGLAVIGTQCAKADERYQDLLQDENLERRSSAIVSLASRPLNSDIVRYVKGLLDHHESIIRRAAIVVIFMSCKEFPEAYALLNNCRNDPDPEVRSIIETVLNERFGWGCTPSETDEGSQSRIEE